MTYSIYPMEKTDLAQVTAIDRQAFPTQWPPANYRQELSNRLAHYIVACDDSRIAEAPEITEQKGLMSWLRPLLGRRNSIEVASSGNNRRFIIGFSGIWVIADEAHITNIAVRHEYQRQGIGELLMIATVDLARQLHATIMTLEVRASNTVAQSLYTKFGFEQTGIRHRYYLDNHEDAVVMTTESIDSPVFKERIEQLRGEVTKKFESR